MGVCTEDVDFVRFFAFKKDVDPGVVTSNDAQGGIIVGRRISLTEQIEAPIFESHPALLNVVEAPFILSADFFSPLRSSFLNDSIFIFALAHAAGLSEPVPFDRKHINCQLSPVTDAICKRDFELLRRGPARTNLSAHDHGPEALAVALSHEKPVQRTITSGTSARIEAEQAQVFSPSCHNPLDKERRGSANFGNETANHLFHSRNTGVCCGNNRFLFHAANMGDDRYQYCQGKQQIGLARLFR